MPERILIAGGQVVTAEAVVRADVLVEGERIVAVASGADWPCDRRLDASGCYVLPGGVDAHTHLESPSDGFTTRTADDFYTGTVAAAFGGTTTVIDFVKAEPGIGIYDSYQRRVEAAAQRCVVDFSFHPVVPTSAGEDDSIAELLRLAAQGATSWKFFMAYPGTMMVDDGVLIAGFRACADNGLLPMVHAENGHMVAALTRDLVTSGQTAEHDQPRAHPHVVESEAVGRAAAIAQLTSAPLFVVHVSSHFAAREIARARLRGQRVFGETCPQYLLTAYEDYANLGFDAARYICSPPIRERANQEELWKHLLSGTLETIGTDHASFTMDQPADLPPQKPRGRGNFLRIPNGVPGIEERLLVMYETGVVGGRFDLRRFVDLVSTRPAQLFGLFPRKGVVAPGSDADLVVWDPRRSRTIAATEQHSRAHYSLYEGRHVSGSPLYVLSRGTVIVADGELSAAAGRGHYLPCDRPDTSL